MAASSCPSRCATAGTGTPSRSSIVACVCLVPCSPIAGSPAAAAAGLPAIGLHGTRHTHATMLLRDGVPVPAVAQRLGHEDAAITLSTYTHFVPADDALAADATSRVLFASA